MRIRLSQTYVQAGIPGGENNAVALRPDNYGEQRLIGVFQRAEFDAVFVKMPKHLRPRMAFAYQVG